MKTKIAALLALACSSSFATTPGSIAPVTFALTLTEDKPSTSKLLKDGGTEYTYSRASSKVVNTVILAEATRRGLLTAGNYKGWQIVAAFDRDAVFYDVYAYNKTLNQAVSLREIMTISGDQGARSEAGKVRRTAQDAIASGSLKGTEVVVITLWVGDVTYVGTASYNFTETLGKTVAVGGFQWLYKGGAGTFVGFGDDESPLVGKITLGAPVKIADMDTLFAD